MIGPFSPRDSSSVFKEQNAVKTEASVLTHIDLYKNRTRNFAVIAII